VPVRRRHLALSRAVLRGHAPGSRENVSSAAHAQRRVRHVASQTSGSVPTCRLRWTSWAWHRRQPLRFHLYGWHRLWASSGAARRPVPVALYCRRACARIVAFALRLSVPWHHHAQAGGQPDSAKAALLLRRLLCFVMPIVAKRRRDEFFAKVRSALRRLGCYFVRIHATEIVRGSNSPGTNRAERSFACAINLKRMADWWKRCVPIGSGEARRESR
jgi:hypothetical protein